MSNTTIHRSTSGINEEEFQSGNRTWLSDGNAILSMRDEFGRPWTYVIAGKAETLIDYHGDHFDLRDPRVDEYLSPRGIAIVNWFAENVIAPGEVAA